MEESKLNEKNERQNIKPKTYIVSIFNNMKVAL